MQFLLSANHQFFRFLWIAYGSKDQIYDRIDRILDNFDSHPSIKNIKRNFRIVSKVSFQPVFKEFVKDIVKELSSNKAAECGFPFHHLTNCINKAM